MLIQEYSFRKLHWFQIQDYAHFYNIQELVTITVHCNGFKFLGFYTWCLLVFNIIFLEKWWSLVGSYIHVLLCLWSHLTTVDVQMHSPPFAISLSFWVNRLVPVVLHGARAKRSWVSRPGWRNLRQKVAAHFRSMFRPEGATCEGSVDV